MSLPKSVFYVIKIEKWYILLKKNGVDLWFLVLVCYCYSLFAKNGIISHLASALLLYGLGCAWLSFFNHAILPSK